MPVCICLFNIKMLRKCNFIAIKFSFFLLFLSLTACVHVASKNQFISSSSSVSSELPLCELAHRTDILVNNADGLNPDNIAFLNWNIYKGNDRGWQDDLSTFSENHDVMTIQEATLSEDMIALLYKHGFNWIMNTAFYLNGTAAGVMNVANSRAIYSCGFKVNEPLIRIPKSVLVSYYPIAGSDEQLLVANIHGINFTLGLSDYSEQLDKLYNAVKYHDGPMIVAGDFNSWSDNRMALVKKLAEKLKLSALEYVVNNKTHLFGNAIDHVFYRQLEPLNHEVQQVTSSDHNPVSVNFRFRV